MSVNNHVVPPHPLEQLEAVSQEDSWLNDVGSLSRPPTAPAPPGAPQPQSTTDSKAGEAPAAPASGAAAPLPAHIAAGHPLWPAALVLSERIWQEMQQKADRSSIPAAVLVKYVRRRVVEIMHTEAALVQQISDITQAQAFLQCITSEVLGYGPLESLLKDESVTKIMAAGPRSVYIEREGKVEDVACFFDDDRHMLRIIENMLWRAGQRLPTNWPIVDVRLPEGSLVNVVLPPSALNGPTITILKGPQKPLDVGDLRTAGTLTQQAADFLCACVQGRLNIVICGEVDSGRTTLLNALSTYIPAHERIATLEEVAELRLSQKHVIALVAQLASGVGGGNVTLRDLVVNALRTGSERILLDECRGAEVAELVQAMNNGYGGTLMTVYAHDVRNCLTRLEDMYLAAGATLPLALIRAQLATALDLIVYVSRLHDGSHRILNIAEVQHVENAAIKLQCIFHYRYGDYAGAAGKARGSFEPSGFAPSFLPRLKAMGLHLSPEIFKPRNMYSPSAASV